MPVCARLSISIRVPSPMKHPEKIDMVVFRENTEDLYAGIEFEAGSSAAEKVRCFLNDQMGTALTDDTGLGIKPISARNTKRLVASAIAHAVDNGMQERYIDAQRQYYEIYRGRFRQVGL